MTRICIIGGGSSVTRTMLIALAMAEVARVSDSGRRYDVLAIDECTAVEPSVGKANKGKGQRKANRANRWR